jgi:hypothetical protein
MLISNVCFWKYKHEITITNFSWSVKTGDLLLVAVCEECHQDVARVI